jgi:drug efflux transport system permease protein
MWQRIRRLIAKEFLAIWRDPKSRTVLIVPPLLELIVFVYAATQEVKNVHMATLDLDRSTASRELISRFDSSRTFTSNRRLQSVAEIRPVVDSQEVILVLHIPQDFTRRLAAGRPASVQLILDGRKSNAAQIVAGYAESIVQSFSSQFASASGSPQIQVDSVGRSEVIPRAWFNPNLENIWSVVPNLVAILTALIGLIVTALSVARERELGTFEQLLVSPLRPREILIGKTVPALVLGLLEGGAMVVVAVTWFRVPFTGSAALLIVSMVAYLLAIIGVGLFISSLAKTQQQAILGVFSFNVPAILLSGFATPLENTPVWLRWTGTINPIRYFMVISKGIFLEGIEPQVVLNNLWPLLLIATATLTAAGWLFRRRLE